MKRRVISLITALTLCLSLCPTWALAAGWEPDTGLCPHHQAHTEECGYVPPTPEQDCTHEHDEDCFAAETLCVHQHGEDCYSEPEPSLCPHECSEDSGCVTLTLNCPHIHDESCGYAPADDGAPCTFVCRICPIEDLIGELPLSVTPDNKAQVVDQLSTISELYIELTAGEQEQLDLSQCLDLWIQLDAANAAMLADDGDFDFSAGKENGITKDMVFQSASAVNSTWIYALHSYTLNAPSSTAFQVSGTGKLQITGDTGSKVVSKSGAGVEVQAGGVLLIENADITVQGSTYGLKIASGAKVQLSSGTFTGNTAAILLDGNNGNYADLLATGYTYFDANGNRIPLESVATAKTVVIKKCTDHSYEYVPSSDAPTHTWMCTICKESSTPEKCTFAFDANGQGACVCKNNISIAVGINWTYDGQVKKVEPTVTLAGNPGKVLIAESDYTVDYVPRSDVGEVTVTVTGITYKGTFTKTYKVTQAQPKIKWAETTKEVDYNGSPVTAADLPNVTITASDDLRGYLEYSYQEVVNGKTTGTGFTSGLPTDAGTYLIKASIPEQQNYAAAETNPCLTLTINQVPGVTDTNKPTAIQPLTYNGTPQALVTAGSALGDVVIEFARDKDGPYSTTIPTETNAGIHTVWYKAENTRNYSGLPATRVDVTISPKEITPKIELSETSYVYDGSKKTPKITVKDGLNVIDEDQYTISWDKDQIVVGTHTVTVTAVDNGNYTFKSTAQAEMEIVSATQSALSITGKPSCVYYGDKITTLSTAGGTGNGTVKWEITSLTSSASTFNTSTGVLEIKEMGTFTIKATREVDNYGSVSDSWTFAVERKPVTAKVEIAAKDYDGNKDIANNMISATVATADLVNGSDTLTISGLKGTYDDANAGTNKSVTLDSSGVTVGGNTDKYSVSYPATATADINQKEITNLNITLSGNDLQQSGNTYSYTFDGTERRPTVTVTAGSETIPDTEYTVSYSNNKNASSTGKNATVTVTSTTGGNYTFADKTVNFQILQAQATLTSSPWAKDLTYTGTEQDLVTVGTSSGGKVVYSLSQNGSYTEAVPQGENVGTYTVYYKIEGDNNYKGSTNPWSVSVTIKQKEVISPAITVSPSNVIYTGSAQTPGVTVTDGTMTIPAGEYDVEYSNNINAGTATVKIINKNGGNYIVNGTTTFEIAQKVVDPNITLSYYETTYDGTPKEPSVISVTVTDNGEVINLSEYSVTYSNNRDVGIATVTIKDTGGNYEINKSVTFEIKPGSSRLTAEPQWAKSLTYNGSEQALVTTSGTAENGEVVYLVNDDSTGTYNSSIPTGKNAGTYTVWYKVQGNTGYNDTEPSSEEVEIERKDISSNDITVEYNNADGNASITVKANGTVIDSKEYTATFQTNADTGIVTITITDSGDGNYRIGEEPLTFTINAPNDDTPSSGETSGNDTTGGTDNENPTNPTTDESDPESIPMQTSVENGTAVTVLDPEAGDKLVAAASENKNVVIKPEITEDVTKTEVSIPASVINQLGSETNAALTVSTPIADVTIPNEALGTLSSADSPVSIVTEQTGNTVVLTLTADGSPVENVPGGLTLAVPVENAGPGTVAVLIHSDGTREIIRKSVAGDGTVNIPLDGSATVEITDNSKDFADVSSESWEADAVAFASAHELLGGTSEETFSPEQPMSLAMLAAVLYNLEGCPGQSPADESSEGDDLYAAGASWAEEKGITTGNDDISFDPDNVTREQFVVMLWRYAGSPGTDNQELNFPDADQVSSNARDAMLWATANGVLNGHGDGRLDPGGPVTRAQTAQILKNFMENT